MLFKIAGLPCSGGKFSGFDIADEGKLPEGRPYCNDCPMGKYSLGLVPSNVDDSVFLVPCGALGLGRRVDSDMDDVLPCHCDVGVNLGDVEVNLDDGARQLAMLHGHVLEFFDI